jgi:mono/diheme cytochrome c family protein
MRRYSFAILAGGCLAAWSLPAAANPQDIEAGRQLAGEACAACHSVAPGAPAPRPVYDPDQQAFVRAPAFAAIARDPRKDDVYLRAIIQAPHYPMREQALDERDLASIVAYIDSLRPQRPMPQPSSKP